MKLTKIESYEIQAFAFRVMTGYMAPGKDSSPLADEAPYEERCAAWDEWRNKYAHCILAMLHGFEALIDRDDEQEVVTSLLAQLSAAKDRIAELTPVAGMDWRETMQRMLTRMNEACRWPAICDEARAVLSLANDATREPAAYLWGGCLWRTDEMGRGRPGAVELYRAQTPLTDADITALLPIWQQGSWTLPDYGRWVARAVERAHGIKTSHNLCLSCGHSIDAHDRQYGCAEDGCDCETPNDQHNRPASAGPG